MEKQSLYIYKLDAQGNKVKFPNDTMPAKLGEYTYTAQRMAGTPTLTATLNYPTCLDDEWSGEEFVEFRGERYYVGQVPTSSKDNKSIMYKHELQFVSERIVLENVYFLDVVTAGADTYHSNSTTVKFMGDINEFVGRLNASMTKSGIGYSVVIDEGITSESKLVSLDNVYLAEALQSIYTIYDLPYYFVGKVCHIGYTENVISTPFEYRKGLISVKKTNANYKIVNRVTGVGSSDNIPFYYPNDSEYGELSFTTTSTIDNITVSPLVIRGYLGKSPDGMTFTYYDKRGKEVFSVSNTGHVEATPLSGFSSVQISPLGKKGAIKQLVVRETYTNELTIGNCEGNLVPTIENFGLWQDNMPDTLPHDKETWEVEEYTVEAGEGVSYEKSGNSLLLKAPYTVESEGATQIKVKVTCRVKITLNNIRSALTHISGLEVLERLRLSYLFKYDDSSLEVIKSGYERYFKYGDGKRVSYEDSGIGNLPEDTYLPPFTITFKEDFSSKKPYADALMPPVYRESGGEDRFYNALNDTYKIPGKDEYYVFKNPYTAHEVREAKVDFSDIKPTIEGVRNAEVSEEYPEGQLFGEIADVAFDQNDSDELGTGTGNNVFNGTDEYVHSYFYIKLHIYNGAYGFNLFEQGLEGGTAVINMTSGNCAACEFEIGVTYKDDDPLRAFNPVLVDASGSIPAGDFEQKVTSNTAQYVERQQDTSKNEVWIAVKKDNASFGVVMPNATNNYRPQKGDKFVITGIKMPKPLVLAAEERLEEALIKYMSENNEEKFNFSVGFSRVFLAENKQVAGLLNENSRITVRYDGKEHLLYVNSFSCKADKECLYDISVELTDTLSASQSVLRQTISEIAGDVVGAAMAGANNYFDWIAPGYSKFLRKDAPDSTRYPVSFLSGLSTGEYEPGRSGAHVGNDGGAELLSAVVRSFLQSPAFTGGLNGNGWKLWMEDALSHLTIDRLTVRQVMSVFELLINKVRSVGGQICVSAANGKIKEVAEEGESYAITFEQPNTFAPGDLMRCQTFTGAELKYYWVEVASVQGETVLAGKADFAPWGARPEAGDECVLMGNTQNPLRQSLILISAAEDGAPRIDVMDGVSSRDFSGSLRTRLGYLSDISDGYDWPEGYAPGDKPENYGLYSDNAYLKGTFLLVTGEDIATKFLITEGKIETAVDGVRQGVLSNPSFSAGMSKWETQNEATFFLVGGKWVWTGGGILSKKGNGAEVVQDEGLTAVRIRNTFIRQQSADMRSLPTFPAGADGLKEAVPFTLRFSYRCLKAGTLRAGFTDVDAAGFSPFEAMDVEAPLPATDGYADYACSGLWNGTGNFYISFTGETNIHLPELVADKADSLEHRYQTLFEQSERLVQISAASYDKEGNPLGQSQLFIQPDKAGLVTVDKDGNLAQIGTYEDGKIVLSGKQIQLTGSITAQGNINISEDGSVEMKNAIVSGFVKHQPLVLTAGNMSQYCVYGTEEAQTPLIDIRKCGEWVVLDSSLQPARFGFYDMGAREIRGAEVMLYNHTGREVTLIGLTDENASGIPQQALGAGYVLKADLKVSFPQSSSQPYEAYRWQLAGIGLTGG